MIKMLTKKDFINKLNEEILKDYGMKIDGFGEKESSTLAFFSPMSKGIYINIHNKNIFNDYYDFMETMLHENVHKINDVKGIKDTYMQGNAQIHNDNFRNAMIENYNMFCSESHTGGIDFKDSRNNQVFKEMMIKRFKHKKVFNELQEIYFKSIYVKLSQVEKYEDNGETYEINDEDGIEILLV